MNIAFFLTPKNDVAYPFDDDSLRQGLEKLRHHGYTAVPVLTRTGKYVGTISEGDCLWYLLQCSVRNHPLTLKQAEDTLVRQALPADKNPPVRITASIEQLLMKATDQNFVPVIDDLESFIGIVTRKDIIKYFLNQKYKHQDITTESTK